MFVVMQVFVHLRTMSPGAVGGGRTQTVIAISYYRIHYLQWTGVTVIDRIPGQLGLVLVLTLCVLGFRLAVDSVRGRVMPR